ncbi:MAG: IgGFc-binding protein [Gammaproteobacteria bacterium]|nr:IgGFc-binding protein [Gammaproteobacteria bacterium]
MTHSLRSSLPASIKYRKLVGLSEYYLHKTPKTVKQRIMTWLSCAVALAAVFGGSAAHAVLDNKGTDFILAFNPNFDATGIVELHLTGDVATTVTVHYPVNSPTFINTYAIIPGSVTTVSLPVTAASGWIANTVQNNAVHVFGSEEFVAYLINLRPQSSDAALGLPVDTMNTEYLVMDYNPAFIGAQFTVYAAYDNTTVTITPTNELVGGHAVGAPFNVVLNRGEGYHARSASAAYSETLTGTEIIADRPVGLVNGNGCTQVPSGVTACDHIFEVAQPVQTWGTDVLVGNLPNRPNGSIYRILASEDNTTVSQDGAAIGTINRGQFMETAQLPGDHLFSADKPIYVAQYMTGQDAPGAIRIGDPAMGNMIPFAQYLQNYTFSTPGGNQFAEHYLTVIAEDADLASILLDGAPIGAGSFTPIAGSGYSVARIPLEEGTHTTASNGFHGITVEGYNAYDSYIYPGGALFQFINPSGDANPPLCSGTVVAGPPPSFAGAATDNRPSEDVNNNGVLDPGEDLNNNGQIDEDTGIFFVALLAGSANLAISVDPFTPGDGSATYTVNLVDPNVSGSGVVEVTDGAGNTCQQPIDLGVEPPRMCDIDVDGDVDRNDISMIFAARNTPASDPSDPRDADGDGTITVLDGRMCVQQCDLPQCSIP